MLRERVQQEIINTEATYVANLETLLEVYIKPLKNLVKDNLVNANDVAAVCSNVGKPRRTVSIGWRCGTRPHNLPHFSNRSCASFPVSVTATALCAMSSGQSALGRGPWRRTAHCDIAKSQLSCAFADCTVTCFQS